MRSTTLEMEMTPLQIDALSVKDFSVH